MFLDVLPFMVFTNMFAIFYLETICMTKTTAQKQNDDKKIGFFINYFITGFFFIVFGLPLLFRFISRKYNESWNRSENTDTSVFGIGY